MKQTKRVTLLFILAAVNLSHISVDTTGSKQEKRQSSVIDLVRY